MFLESNNEIKLHFQCKSINDHLLHFKKFISIFIIIFIIFTLITHMHGFENEVLACLCICCRYCLWWYGIVCGNLNVSLHIVPNENKNSSFVTPFQIVLSSNFEKSSFGFCSTIFLCSFETDEGYRTAFLVASYKCRSVAAMMSSWTSLQSPPLSSPSSPLCPFSHPFITPSGKNKPVPAHTCTCTYTWVHYNTHVCMHTCDKHLTLELQNWLAITCVPT